MSEGPELVETAGKRAKHLVKVLLFGVCAPQALNKFTEVEDDKEGDAPSLA